MATTAARAQHRTCSPSSSPRCYTTCSTRSTSCRRPTGTTRARSSSPSSGARGRGRSTCARMGVRTRSCGSSRMSAGRTSSDCAHAASGGRGMRRASSCTACRMQIGSMRSARSVGCVFLSFACARGDHRYHGSLPSPLVLTTKTFRSHALRRIQRCHKTVRFLRRPHTHSYRVADFGALVHACARSVTQCVARTRWRRRSTRVRDTALPRQAASHPGADEDRAWKADGRKTTQVGA